MEKPFISDLKKNLMKVELGLSLSSTILVGSDYQIVKILKILHPHGKKPFQNHQVSWPNSKIIIWSISLFSSRSISLFSADIKYELILKCYMAGDLH